MVDASKFRLIRTQKNGTLYWSCCRCNCALVTTESLDIVSNAKHRKPCESHPLNEQESHTTDDTNSQANICAHSFVYTKRDKTALVYENHLFYKDSKTSNVWRCAKRLTEKCKSVCRIIDGTIVTPPTEHTHSAYCQNKIKKMNLVHEIKQKALDKPDDKPFTLMSSSIRNAQPIDLVDRDLTNIRQIVYNKRRAVFKRLPKARKECLRELKLMSANGDELVRSVKGNIVMIARKEDLELLNKDNMQIFSDGTFNYSPRFFKQMLTIFVMNRGYYIPVCHFLLVNKQQRTYERALQMLIRECNLNEFSLSEKMKNASVMLDFEQALINSFKKQFPLCNVKGCGFHLGQSWWRKIKELGLTPAYRSPSSAEGKWLRGLFGLPLVPQLITRQVFADYCGTKEGKSPRLKRFQKYIKDTYISKAATFQPSLWADLEGPRTNNGAESFHRHFGDLFGYLKSKPPIWNFLRNVKNFNTIKTIKMASNKLRRITPGQTNNIVLSFLQKRTNVSTMLRVLSFTNQPKCILRRKRN